MPETILSNDELLAAARRIIAAQQALSARPRGLPSDYHGPIDLAYVRGTDVREFPKMVYKKSHVDPRGYITRVVQSQAEQDTLSKGWLVTTAEIHALLDPIAKQAYVSADEIEGSEPEEREASAQAKQAEKNKGKA